MTYTQKLKLRTGTNFRKCVPDRVAGELIKAFIVLKKEFRDKVTESEIMSWARTRLAGYKHPRILEFREEFPGTLFGKFLRRFLREEELRRTEAQQQAEEIFA